MSSKTIGYEQIVIIGVMNSLAFLCVIPISDTYTMCSYPRDSAVEQWSTLSFLSMNGSNMRSSLNTVTHTKFHCLYFPFFLSHGNE